MMNDDSVWHNHNFRYLLTIIDHFSKYLWVFPLKSRESNLIAESLRTLFNNGHIPESIHADNEFRAGSVQIELNKHSIKFVPSAPYKPHSHGCVERVNRTLKAMIARHQTMFNDALYVDALHQIVHNYNYKRHSSHKLTSAQVYNMKPDEIDKVNKRLHGSGTTIH